MVNISIDSSLKDLTLKIIELASCQQIISSYIQDHSDFQHGRVNHALCACLKEIMRVYILFCILYKFKGISCTYCSIGTSSTRRFYF